MTVETRILIFICIFLLLTSILLSIFIISKIRNSNSAILLEQLKNYEKKLDAYEKNLKDEFERNRKETSETNRSTRKENTENLMAFQNSVNAKLDAFSQNTHQSLSTNLTNFLKTLTGRVDVLEAVQKGLGEMKNLANDVGGLKRALTNVKTAGGMGEIQLEAILSQILSPEQYIKNAHPNPNDTKKVVEFAIKIPSKNKNGEYIFLPIDSKYPAAVWDKLSLAYQTAEKSEIEIQKKALVADIKKMAKDIKEKYIEVPYTTDFGLMFLPFEGLFAEVMRIPGLFQQIQDEFKVTIAGPTTLGAFLNSLQMGFRTLAIQKETSKVWDLLGAVKNEFGKFGDVLEATKRKLESASSEIGKAETRSRAIERKLKNVDAMSVAKISESEQETDFLE